MCKRSASLLLKIKRFFIQYELNLTHVRSPIKCVLSLHFLLKGKCDTYPGVVRSPCALTLLFSPLFSHKNYQQKYHCQVRGTIPLHSTCGCYVGHKKLCLHRSMPEYQPISNSFVFSCKPSEYKFLFKKTINVESHLFLLFFFYRDVFYIYILWVWELNPEFYLVIKHIRLTSY